VTTTLAPREDLETAVRELKDAAAQNTANPKIQFERIAQIQAEVDALRLGSDRRSRRKKSVPDHLPPAIAADGPSARRPR
jgi:hypothetical protein